jgi:hypothetical protein
MARMSSAEIMEFLESHPTFRDRIESIIGVVRNDNGDIILADDAEDRVVEEVRGFGKEILQGWAEGRVAATEQDVRLMPGVHRQGKKTPLAYEVRQGRGDRAAIPAGKRPSPPLRDKRAGEREGVFSSDATGVGRLRIGPAICHCPD